MTICFFSLFLCTTTINFTKCDNNIVFSVINLTLCGRIKANSSPIFIYMILCYILIPTLHFKSKCLSKFLLLMLSKYK